MKRYLIARLTTAVFILGCSSGTEVKRISANTVTDVSGRWNDTDSRIVAQKIIDQLLKMPWYREFKKKHPGKKPAIIVGTILNKTDEHIDVDTFVADIQAAIASSGKATFVAGRSMREEVREERADQQIHASQETRKSPGQEHGADYMLKGKISSIIDRSGDVAVVYYKVFITLIDLETNEMIPLRPVEIKKVIDRPEWSM